MADVKVKALRNVTYGGKQHKIGDLFEMEDKVAKQCVADGVVEIVKAAGPAQAARAAVAATAKAVGKKPKGEEKDE